MTCGTVKDYESFDRPPRPKLTSQDQRICLLSKGHPEVGPQMVDSSPENLVIPSETPRGTESGEVLLFLFVLVT